MTESEGLRIMAMLRGVWGSRQKLDDAAVALWPRLLADLPFRDVDAAVTRLAKTSKWLPTVAEIRAEVAEDKCSLPEPEVAWGHVLKAVSKFGSYQAPAFEFDEVKRAVEVLGWQNICLDENVAATRARFTDAYRAIRERRIELEVTGRYVAPDRALEAGKPTLRLVPESNALTAEEAMAAVAELAAKVAGEKP